MDTLDLGGVGSDGVVMPPLPYFGTICRVQAILSDDHASFTIAIASSIFDASKGKNDSCHEFDPHDS